MRLRRWKVPLRGAIALVLAVTALPFVAAWWPRGALPVLPLGPGDLGPVPGRLVVQPRHRLAAAELERLQGVAGRGLHLTADAAGAGDMLTAEVAPGTEDRVLAALRKEPLVESADRMDRYRASWRPNDPRYPEQWNLKLIDAEHAWDRARGRGVTVAVIDTGVAFENDEHCYQAQDFRGTRFTGGWDFVHHNAHPNDDQGHGTHVAGTIAETTDNREGVAGLAFEATVMPVKVLDELGTGTVDQIAAGIRFASDHGAQVINLSLGGPYPNAVLRSACRYARKKGVLLVCAAGNGAGGPVGYPAGFPECLAVSAVGPSGELAWYSSLGPQVAIAAPGGDTASGGRAGGVLQNTVTYEDGERHDSYLAFQGTSMASPHVAATAALIMSLGVSDADQVRQLLTRGAIRKGPAREYGAGVVNAGRTVALAAAVAGDAWLRLLVSALLAVATVLAVVRRSRLAGPALGALLGFTLPDAAVHVLGYGSPWNVLPHSGIVALFLLTELEGKAARRFLAAFAATGAAHLAWDALRIYTPFPAVAPGLALPWLWVNATAALGVAIAALDSSGDSPPPPGESAPIPARAR